MAEAGNLSADGRVPYDLFAGVVDEAAANVATSTVDHEGAPVRLGEYSGAAWAQHPAELGEREPGDRPCAETSGPSVSGQRSLIGGVADGRRRPEESHQA